MSAWHITTQDLANPSRRSTPRDSFEQVLMQDKPEDLVDDDGSIER